MKLLSKTQFAVFAICVTSLFAQAPAPKEPEELIRLRQTYNQKRTDALKPIDSINSMSVIVARTLMI